MTDQELIKKCLEEDEASQKALYERYAGYLFMVCLRYARNRQDAEDIFQEGFVRILDNLYQFQFQGSFKGWMSRIMSHTAISFYRKKFRNVEDELPENLDFEENSPDAVDQMSEQELLKLINELPDGYRMVFNMYAIDGYSHEEIGRELNISKGTSRSQLARAREMLQKKLNKITEVFL